MTLVAEIPLIGAAGEPVDFIRTIVLHGVAELPPNRLDFEARGLETTLPITGGVRTVRLTDVDSIRPLLGALVLAALVVSLLASSIYLLPIAVWLAGLWALIAPTIELDAYELGGDVVVGDLPAEIEIAG